MEGKVKEGQKVNEQIILSSEDIDEMFVQNLYLPNANQTSNQFNFNKLHAVLCITASASVSVGILLWLFWP